MLAALLIALSPQPDPTVLRRIFEEALARREREYGMEDAHTAQAARDLGMFLSREGETRSAQNALSEALRIDEKVFGSTAGQTLSDASELAAILPALQAAPLWQRAADAPDPDVAVRALMALGRATNDATYYRRAVARQEAATGPASAPVAVCLNALAQVVGPAEGIPLLQRALAIDRRALGPRHPETATTETNLAGMLVHTARYDEALAAAAEALSIFGETLGPDHPRCAIAASILAFALESKGDRTRAEKMYRLALTIDETAYGPKHPQTINDRRALEEFLRAPRH